MAYAPARLISFAAAQWLLWLLLPSACAAAPAHAGLASKPNIMFVLADDLGYNEMGFMNASRGLITDNLDKLASEGVVLKNYYVQPICSPTRSALMTGRYTIRLGTQSNVIYWDTPWGVPANETFLPQNLKDAGYHTAMFGKWHLGMFMEKYTPMGRGFDEHMGYYQGCESAYTHIAACCKAGSPDSDQDFVCRPGHWSANYTHSAPKDYRGYDWFKSGWPNQGVSKPDLSANHTNSATLITEAAVEFLDRMKSAAHPFFLYLPFQNIHSPYTCDARFRNQYKPSRFTPGEQTMFGYITELDTAVGTIMQAFKASGKYNNSFVIFSSDNGAPPGTPDVNHKVEGKPNWIARNFPLRGWKTQIWEGGTRVAGFVHSPLLPRAVRGTVSHELYHVTDWLPTITALAGGETARNFPLDGHDLWPSISTGSASPRTEMLYSLCVIIMSIEILNCLRFAYDFEIESAYL